MLRVQIRRRLALIAPVVALALISPIVPARAATTIVTASGHTFSPSSVTVTLGSVVTWKFASTHTSTSNQGFWNSGTKTAGQSYDRVLLDAGTFPYYCKIHGPTMKGTVKVPVKSSGTSSSGYTLRWSSRSGTTSVRYDVQYKRVGTTTWSNWRTGTASRTATFNPSGAHSYYVHARTRIGTHISSWSPSITLKIT